MRRIEVRLPMHRKDPETGTVKQVYAKYEGNEVMVPAADRIKYKTARLFHLQNSKNEEYQFRIRGNGQYEMIKLNLGDKPIAMGTMMDATPPEIIVQAG